MNTLRVPLRNNPRFFTFGARRTGKTAALQRAAEDYCARATIAGPVVGCDVSACGCTTYVTAYRDPDGTMHITDSSTDPCVQHNTIPGEVVRKELS